jgi:hypothetical protein
MFAAGLAAGACKKTSRWPWSLVGHLLDMVTISREKEYVLTPKEDIGFSL